MIYSSACTDNSEESAQSIIKVAELTEREESLIKGTGINQSFVFEYQEKKEIEKTDIWIEKYIGGEKIGPILKTTNPVNNDNSKYIMFNMTNIQGDNLWSISFIEGQNISTGKITAQNELGKTSTWDTIDSIEVEKGEYILGAFVGNDGNTINGVPNEFFLEPESYMDELLANDYVYLLKIKIY
jgi:hypothetical protein